MKEHQHFILNKPYGVICQFVEVKKRKKILLGDMYDFPKGTMSVGRLDVPSEGLLLLTTDGKLSNFVCSSGMEKEYYVQVDGLIDDEAIERLRTGIEISVNKQKYMTLPAKVRRLEENPIQFERARRVRDERHGPSSWISITITEGKFRQVRKMTAAAGFPTLRLVRMRVGGLYLEDLQPGEVKVLENPMDALSLETSQ